MTETPIVSIICLCYNHEKFLEEALLSVLQQDYPNKEIIVVDDASTDGSVVVIQKIVKDHPTITFLQNPDNLGNCASFNLAFAKSKGTFLIDFATDDVLLPGTITRQVAAFSDLSEQYGVLYSDAEIINEKGDFLRYHHKGTALASFHPEGDVFQDLLQRYFICPPTMMIKREVLEKTKGYDASLAYEDFNFWVQSSREFYYAYIPEALVRRRITSHSLSSKHYTRNNDTLFFSTLQVLKKASQLCRTKEEFSALTKRVKYEMRHSILMEAFLTGEEYKTLLIQLNAYDLFSRFLYFISKNKIRLYGLYKIGLNVKGVYAHRNA